MAKAEKATTETEEKPHGCREAFVVEELQFDKEKLRGIHRRELVWEGTLWGWLLERWSLVSWTCEKAGAKKLQKTASHKLLWRGLQGVLGAKLLREIVLVCALTMTIQHKFMHLLCSIWGLATGIAEVGKV